MPSAPGAPAVTVRVVMQESGGVRRRRLPRPGNVLSTLVALALAVALFLVVGVMTGILSIGNPFATTTIDRSPLRCSSSSRTSRRTRRRRSVPADDRCGRRRLDPSSFLAGEHTVFLAQGSVDARVDFSGLATDAVQMQSDKTVSVNLPEPDPRQGRDRHAREPRRQPGPWSVERVGGVQRQPERPTALLRAGAEEAGRGSEARRSRSAPAETNTARMLRGLSARSGPRRCRCTS